MPRIQALPFRSGCHQCERSLSNFPIKTTYSTDCHGHFVSYSPYSELQSSRWGLCPVQQTLDVECGRHCSTPWERLSSTAFSGEQSKLHFLDLQRQGRFTKAWPAFFTFYVEAGLLICIFLWTGVLSGAPRRQWACRLRSLQRSAVVEVGPAELEASIRGGGAVILDIYAIWCFDLKSEQFFLGQCFHFHLDLPGL